MGWGGGKGKVNDPILGPRPTLTGAISSGIGSAGHLPQDEGKGVDVNLQAVLQAEVDAPFKDLRSHVATGAHLPWREGEEIKGEEIRGRRSRGRRSGGGDQGEETH